MEQLYDVAIIGGGINGCGCAADAAMRGLSVFLCEQDDLAAKTSSSSTKLIHGGLRYLEYFDFSLVKKALDERQTLLHIAPHLVYPLPIVLPHKKHMRPSLILRAGLFLYDHLSRKNRLPASQSVRRKQNPEYFAPLAKELSKGFLFYDCITDDARLTVANALQAKQHGAAILTRTKLIAAEACEQQWRLTLQSGKTTPFQIRAKTVINATGPWAEYVNTMLHAPATYNLTLVKGSHIVVHKLYEGQHAYMLQHDDKRIVFVIPYHGYTLIGTTDVAFQQKLEEVHIDAAEINYLLTLVNKYFRQTIDEKDIIHTWSGIRPLLSAEGKSLKALSRDYAYSYYNTPAPLVSIFGGKITTYRRLAEQAVEQLRTTFPHLKPSCTQVTPLPGARFKELDLSRYEAYALDKYFWLDEKILHHYLKNYGTRTELLLADAHTQSDLGLKFTDTLYQIEVNYLINEEWAQTAEDILWRRTKLGFEANAETQLALHDYLSDKKTSHATCRQSEISA
ncbi:glycerol-3-phosphate dehydrogenase [Legionella septentrionalis]|uniref:glycerol-3-phosphate dehydrogenase n=1 Tax=Legionella septentrionalis TaxID=2498109 RepID=UPI000F8F22F0|nr:glycerol-3-phosphate dehydrogenase [Legionella septentrionalis]RUQ95105.1 glycerol-3-phosphate dehydrogenase [Legionella septentrionalis]